MPSQKQFDDLNSYEYLKLLKHALIPTHEHAILVQSVFSFPLQKYLLSLNYLLITYSHCVK